MKALILILSLLVSSCMGVQYHIETPDGWKASASDYTDREGVSFSLKLPNGAEVLLQKESVNSSNPITAQTELITELLKRVKP